MINDETDYMNGSPIQLDQLHYIATDSPMPAAFEKYWGMIWKKGVHQIVNLTESIEDRKIKSHNYWPNLNESYTLMH